MYFVFLLSLGISLSFACFGPFSPIPKLNHLCYRLGDEVMLDTRYFDLVYKNTSSNTIIDHISSVISNVLETRNLIILRANMQGISFVKICKHSKFIKQFAERIQNEFPNKLDTCYVYNMPHSFSVFLNVLSFFTDEKTHSRIKNLGDCVYKLGE